MKTNPMNDFGGALDAQTDADYEAHYGLNEPVCGENGYCGECPSCKGTEAKEAITKSVEDIAERLYELINSSVTNEKEKHDLRNTIMTVQTVTYKLNKLRV